MPKVEVPLNQLSQYLPDNTYELVMAYLNHYKVHLTIAKNRQSVLGDYRHKNGVKNHRISVNGNLNKYAFLITLLHELAHLVTYEKFGNAVNAHGKEWKHIYGGILSKFIEATIFPVDIEAALKKTLNNPGASTCSEEGLQRVLYRYNTNPKGLKLVEDLAPGTFFKIKGERVFQKGDKRGKRYLCQELKTGKQYLFSGIYEVLPLPNSINSI